jgi:tetratricopeptide (TPR) repeat protein
VAFPLIGGKFSWVITEDYMSVKRYSKKDLKQPDEFITFSARLLRVVIEQKNIIMAALVGIVALVLIVTAVNYFSQKADVQSLQMLSEVVSRYETLQNEGGDVDAYQGTKDGLTEIVDTYGSNIGGKLANFFLANASFAAGEYETSAALYRKAAADFKGALPFETLAKSSLGYALAQQGDHEAAAGVFEKMATADGAVMADELLFALARQYAATGKTELQEETARKLIETFPESIYTNVMQEQFPSLVQQQSEG